LEPHKLARVDGRWRHGPAPRVTSSSRLSIALPPCGCPSLRTRRSDRQTPARGCLAGPCDPGHYLKP